MQTYETLFVTTPTLTEEEERTTVDALAQIVSDGGGTMVVNERMGRRRLAYPIEKHADGVYIRFLYDSECEVPKELERRLRISDRILRMLTVRMEPNWAEASKKQAVLDAQARIEAAEREKLEAEEAARKAAEEAANPPAENAAAADGSEGDAPDADAPEADAPKAESVVDDAEVAPAAESEEN